MTTRKVQTEVELESGQSFVIAGLLDNEITETLNKIPGLANIPLLGKLFQSRSRPKDNTELLVIVTPEVVRPIPAGQPVPELNYPQPFLKANSPVPMQQPGMDKTGPVPVQPRLARAFPSNNWCSAASRDRRAPAPNQDSRARAQQPAAKPVQAPPPGGGPGGNDK